MRNAPDSRLTVLLSTVAAILTIYSIVSGPTRADVVTVAVATSFQPVLAVLADSFFNRTGNRVVMATGSTGNLLSQIVNNAPFDLFMAADTASITTLANKGLTTPGSIRTYAYGKLVAISGTIPGSVPLPDALSRAKRIALALPSTAPYGRAAREVLVQLNRWSVDSVRCIFAQSAGQCFQFGSTGNVDLAFIALSTLRASEKKFTGVWQIEPALYAPIEQRMAVLKTRHIAAAESFGVFLSTPAGRAIIESFGYELSR